MAAQNLNRAFYSALDTMLLVEQGVTPSGGEDSFTRALGTDSAMLGVFDGCGTVFVFAPKGSPAESYCLEHTNCIFVEQTQG